MKFSVLDEFLNKDFNNVWEGSFPGEQKMLAKVLALEERLERTLSDEEKDIFEDFRIEFECLYDAKNCWKFKVGFRYGLLLAMEAVEMDVLNQSEFCRMSKTEDEDDSENEFI